MIILWGLWTRRNKHFHRQIDRREADVEVMAKQMLLDYSDENKKTSQEGSARPNYTSRNSDEEVLVSRAKSECYANSPLEAEAKAIWKGGESAAHSIASWALGCTNYVILDGEVPNCATALAVKDAISSEC
ncbi:hypothetical protein Tco_0854341 [Tanacetum coccineum]